ncbi:SAV_915 family protein [Streptomyces fungicidicus]|uniref:SAV_915 family protein n=1 Tax=Streptomyces fungicidicus TaxID=68203 RepID=UPI0033C52B14
MASSGMPQSNPSNPEHLVLPTMSGVRLAADGDVEVTLVPMAGADGQEQLVALAFTSVPLLVEAMGEQQPWVVLPSGEVEDALRGSGARAVLVDPRLAVDAE